MCWLNIDYCLCEGEIIMKFDYEEKAKIIKAISDANRLKIVDILSCGEKCVCEILEHFDFTQPTLSHHMKILMDCGLVNCRKEGIWSYYSLNNNNCNKLMLFIMNVINICYCLLWC